MNLLKGDFAGVIQREQGSELGYKPADFILDCLNIGWKLIFPKS